jgi:hypothetical protein
MPPERVERPPRELRTEVLTVKVSPRERALFEAAAAREHMPLGEYMRAAAAAYEALRFNPGALKLVYEGLMKGLMDAGQKLAGGLKRAPLRPERR